MNQTGPRGWAGAQAQLHDAADAARQIAGDTEPAPARPSPPGSAATRCDIPGPLIRPPLRTAPDELDQVMRLDQFRRDHPGVVIGAGSGWWQARIPEPDGELVITRYTLRELLDKLDQLTATPPDRSPG